MPSHIPSSLASHVLSLIGLYGIEFFIGTLTLLVLAWAGFQFSETSHSKTTIKHSGIHVSSRLDGQVKVSKILIHPIKSCKGFSVNSAKYTPEGIENDRLWCIIDAVALKVLTAREVAKMVLITPSIEEGQLRVSFPEDSGCEGFSVPVNPSAEVLSAWEIVPEVTLWATHGPLDGYICEAPTAAKGTVSGILSKYFGRPVHLMFKGPRARHIDPTPAFPRLVATAKYQDMYPLLVLSQESTTAIEHELRKHVGTQGIGERWKSDLVPIERFRPNIVLEGGGPFAEDDWEEVTIGAVDGPTLILVSRCTRCLLPNVDPETGERDKAVPYKVLMKFRTGLVAAHNMKPCVGVNAVPLRKGVVSVGDEVFVKKTL